MNDAWYEGLPDDYFKTDEDRAYEAAFTKIREGLDRGLGFDEACTDIDVEDDTLKAQIKVDMLKVLIAEEHFAKHIPLEDLSEKLKVSLTRLEAAKNIMLEEVQEPPLKNYNSNNTGRQ